MYSVNILGEAGASSGSIWIPILVLGWFVIMTVVGWQVSRRNMALGDRPPDVDQSHSESNPSEFDNH
jgi:purine-cytosine permease-like protein